jgi:hypothetical protein
MARPFSDMDRVLYFDIDGVLLDYEDHPKEGLREGRLQQALARAGFTKLVCVSGWSDLFASSALKLSLEQRKQAICKLLSDLLDPEFLKNRLELAQDTDNRCHSIDVNADFYYMDDWADEYATKEFGKEFYEAHLGARILRVDPYGDGSDILAWLDGLGQEPRPLE